MNNKSIQFLRGTREALKKNLDRETLQPGQPLYNITDNELVIGGGAGDKLNREPISVRELKGNIAGINSDNKETYDYSIKYDEGSGSFSLNSEIKMSLTSKKGLAINSNAIALNAGDTNPSSLTITSTSVKVNKAPTKEDEVLRFQEYNKLNTRVSSLEAYPFTKYANKTENNEFTGKNTFNGVGNLFTQELELQNGLNLRGIIDVSKNISKSLNLKSGGFAASIKLPNQGVLSSLTIQLPQYPSKDAYGTPSGVDILNPTFFNNLFCLKLKRDQSKKPPIQYFSNKYFTIGSLSIIGYNPSIDIQLIPMVNGELITNIYNILKDNGFKSIISSGYLIECDTDGNIVAQAQALPIVDFYVDTRTYQGKIEPRLNIQVRDIEGRLGTLYLTQSTTNIGNLIVKCDWPVNLSY